MPYMLVRHKVVDFVSWKKVFDEVEPMRKEAGEKSAQLFRDADDPNMITAVFEWDSLDNAHNYASSPRLKSAMEKAGVVGPPHIWFANAG
ncbi:MAG: putative quinol monooxygenase [Paracoccaceae bacterium]